VGYLYDIQDKLNSPRAGLTIVPVVPWEGPTAARGSPINCRNFTTLFECPESFVQA